MLAILSEMDTSITTIDAYIKQFPKETQEKLQELRKVIREEAPEAKEKIAYGLATFTLHGNLVHFGGFKNHIGFFPSSSPLEKEIPEAAKYRTGKGTLQFPLQDPIPFDFVRKVVRFRVKENTERGKK